MFLSESRLNKSDRQARIVAELRAAPTLRVNELAGLLDVSTETVRRDLAELDERGLINRTYGGAMRPIAFEPALAERESLMVAERERIAAAAVELVEPNDIKSARYATKWRKTAYVMPGEIPMSDSASAARATDGNQ